jgi:hypothetical protein
MYPPDWSRPWWQDWRPWVEPAWGAWQEAAQRHAPGDSLLPDVLNRLGEGAPVRFVPQSALPEGESYEGFIFQQRQVPTRDNLHDLFNACCWRRFPLTKARLNALQAEVIGREGVGTTRGPLRDALTLFDENVLLLQSTPAMWDALQRHDWRTLLVTQRDDWCSAGLCPDTAERTAPVRPVVFGHALLEKLCQPYKAVTAHVFWVDPSLPASEPAWDAWLAERLTAPFMATKPFQPLPVLGIPGWCVDNAQPSFYDDVRVFRPLSARTSSVR